MFRLPWRFFIMGIGLIFFGFKTVDILKSYNNSYALSRNIRHGDLFSKNFDNSTNFVTNSSDQYIENIMCENVWNNVTLSRERSFSSNINPTHFVVNEYLDFVLVNDGICKELNTNSSKGTRLLVVLVSSTRSHFNERKIIRETWGSFQEYSGGWNVKLVFLLGQSEYCLNGEKKSHKIVAGSKSWNNSKTEEIKLDKEQEKWGDIVMGSFSDNYRNNTYRHLMGYKFILEKCPQAEFIVKTDDDVFVNIPMILDKRSKETKNPKIKANDMYCKIMKNKAPSRCKKCWRKKWFTTKEEWPTEKFPTFCLGAFYGVTRHWVEMMYKVKNFGGFYWIDDVLISGRLREIAEKEFKVQAKLMDVTKLVRYGLPKGLCQNVNQKNVAKKRKNLSMFVHLARNKNTERQMKCLSNILMGKNLPFSI